MTRRSLRGLAALLAALGLAACGGHQVVRPRPRVSPTPTPALGILPLGGETMAAVSLGPPFVVQGQLPELPPVLKASRVPPNPLTSLQALVAALGVPGPAVTTGDGVAYNLGSTTGYQLTSPSGYAQFNFHPNTPVDETGATPSVAAADAFVLRFLAARHLPSAGEGLVPLTSATQVHASDRRVFFQWTQNGYPLVGITGSPLEVFADVAANYREQLSLVGLSGAVSPPLLGTPAKYPATTPAQIIKDLNTGQLSPGDYVLNSSGQPYPSPPVAASPAPAPVEITGAQLAVVDSAGFAVPVLVFSVSDQPPLTTFVTCAVATDECAPLRYSTSPPG